MTLNRDMYRNLVAMAFADGKLTADEDEFLEKKRKLYKIKKQEHKKLVKEAQKQEVEIKLEGTFVEKVQNLHDMIYLAFLDGELSDEERQHLTAMSQELKLRQEHISAIVQDARKQIESMSGEGTCPSCKALMPPASKFCPSCGASISDKPKDKKVLVEKPEPVPSTGITVEFLFSSSGSFEQAVQEAKKAETFRMFGEGKQAVYRMNYPRKEIERFLPLLEYLKGWRKRKVYVDGELQQWDSVFAFTWCFFQREAAYRSHEYCFFGMNNTLNIWGCTQARLDFADYTDLFKMGSFKDARTFVFNKERIRHDLQNNLFPYRFCPALNFDLVEAVIREFPDVIDPQKDKNWGYRETYHGSDVGCLRLVRKDPYLGEQEVLVDGVKPGSAHVGLDILRSAVKKAGLRLQTPVS